MNRLTIALILAAATTCIAAEPAPLLSASAKDELAGNLRGLLLRHLPTPLYAKDQNWGHQEMVKRRHIRGKLRDIHVEVAHEPRNDGVWKRIRIDAVRPHDTLVFDLRNVLSPEPGKVTFQVFLSLDTHIDYTQQRWESGWKLYDASARARARIRATLDCEATARLENAGVVPDLVINLRVVRADVGYDNLKFEHVAGVGGDAAKIIGEFAHSAIKQWRPSIERDALQKANAAVVKAGEHKEVRLSLTKLLKSSKAQSK